MEGSEELVALPPSGDAHGKPPPDHECMCTMEDITEEDGNYCEYQSAPSMRWHPSKYCAAVVRRLIHKQFPEYVAGVQKADCHADLKRRIAKGPPVWLEDKHALPIPEDDTHICRVWMAADGVEYSAKLVGCKEGEEREALWEELKNFLGPEEEAAEDSAIDDATRGMKLATFDAKPE
ncbi:hypothetical protein AB1Y20_005421 [Prymnesium parvum]|uniref:Uncharacterized protein n=1 Tax=Prymnesium parvum TaxID=97485 RepID=A0AB34J676_PRYPA|mmetsp:Transcript_19025/g.40489  ORF Transcript_19025/g.40489 Transcript_19025/m.40489 type:complete len:178 (+) Transcript_19025:1-534(+)